jgi:hypothetical protein
MPQFISKLQHNTYEKGEFSDEQPRNLDEAIQLIKDFPWDLERPLTDIQLTGPSVTIQDDDINYLKLGLYFGGKFCVYYLDKDNHLYEYHAADIDAAEKLVADFFNKTLDLSVFEKHFFNIGNQPHFITNNFIYKVKPSRVFMLIALLLVYIGLFISFAASIPSDTPFILYPCFLILIIGGFILYTIFLAIQNRSLYLQISRGSNLFYFGKDAQNILAYEKLSIENIVIYDNNDRRGFRLDFNKKIEVKFRNGDYLIIPNILISSYDFLSKFSGKLGIPVIYSSSRLFKRR